MAQISILSQLNFFGLVNSGYKFLTNRREDDVEIEDDETQSGDNDNENSRDNNNDTHEGGERMPDIDDIFRRYDDFAYAECF